MTVNFKHFTVKILPKINILKLLRESLREVKESVILNNDWLLQQDLNYAFHNTFIAPFQIKDSAQYLKHMDYLYFEDVFKQCFFSVYSYQVQLT